MKKRKNFFKNSLLDDKYYWIIITYNNTYKKNQNKNIEYLMQNIYINIYF